MKEHGEEEEVVVIVAKKRCNIIVAIRTAPTTTAKTKFNCVGFVDYN